MTLVCFAPPAVLQPGYLLEMTQDLALADTGGAPVEFCRFSLAPGASTIEDAHEEHEIWFIVAGAGELRLGAETQAVAEGAAIYIKPHARHRLFNRGTSELRVISVYWGASQQGEE